MAQLARSQIIVVGAVGFFVLSFCFAVDADVVFAGFIYSTGVAIGLGGALLRSGRMLDRDEDRIEDMVRMLNDMIQTASFGVRCETCGATAVLAGIGRAIRSKDDDERPIAIDGGLYLPPGWDVVGGNTMCPECLARQS
jgi:hypothetical protein